MKLGISSYSFPWSVGASSTHKPEQPVGAFELIERAQAHGVRVLQLADGMLGLASMSAETLDRLRDTAVAAGIQLEVGTRGTDVETLSPFVAIAKRLGSPLLRAVLRTPKRLLTMAETEALARALLPELERADVCLGIETHESRTGAELRQIMDSVNSPYLGVVFDTANSLGCSENAETVYAAIAPHIVNFHAKDIKIARLPSTFGFTVEGAPAGEGIINLASFVQRIAALNNGKSVPEINTILEHWGPYTGDMASTMTLEVEWVAKGVTYLRTLVPD
jgi:sugar phosphate isomerase/epimerase